MGSNTNIVRFVAIIAIAFTSLIACPGPARDGDVDEDAGGGYYVGGATDAMGGSVNDTWTGTPDTWGGGTEPPQCECPCPAPCPPGCGTPCEPQPVPAPEGCGLVKVMYTHGEFEGGSCDERIEIFVGGDGPVSMVVGGPEYYFQSLCESRSFHVKAATSPDRSGFVTMTFSPVKGRYTVTIPGYNSPQPPNGEGIMSLDVPLNLHGFRVNPVP